MVLSAPFGANQDSMFQSETIWANGFSFDTQLGITITKIRAPCADNFCDKRVSHANSLFIDKNSID